MNQAIPVAFGGLFFYAGVLISKAKRNWFVGIRTPWTLSSEKVWEKTHKLGAKMFKASGVICLLGVIFPAYAFYFVLIPILLAAFISFVYSYFEFRKIKNRK